MGEGSLTLSRSRRVDDAAAEGGNVVVGGKGKRSFLMKLLGFFPVGFNEEKEKKPELQKSHFFSFVLLPFKNKVQDYRILN